MLAWIIGDFVFTRFVDCPCWTKRARFSGTFTTEGSGGGGGSFVFVNGTDLTLVVVVVPLISSTLVLVALPLNTCWWLRELQIVVWVAIQTMVVAVEPVLVVAVFMAQELVFDDWR